MICNIKNKFEKKQRTENIDDIKFRFISNEGTVVANEF